TWNQSHARMLRTWKRSHVARLADTLPANPPECARRAFPALDHQWTIRLHRHLLEDSLLTRVSCSLRKWRRAGLMCSRQVRKCESSLGSGAQCPAEIVREDECSRPGSSPAFPPGLHSP